LASDDTSTTVTQHIWTAGALQESRDFVATEIPAALVYNGISHVVMMVTPQDLEAFALGFSLTEGIIQAPEQLLDFHLLATPNGLELQMQIGSEAFAKLKQRRRQLVGRTGCGLCGEESLAQVTRDLPVVRTAFQLPHLAIQTALAQLPSRQPIYQQTGAVHAAAWCDGAGNPLIVCEDVGRHNAVDKVIGSLAQANRVEREGFLLVSSRASYEIVAKAAMANIAVLVAVSAPTTLAITLAEKSAISLVAFARSNRQVVYSCPERLVL
jgi:formate dehydrogenase accessory protein FdhD